MTDDEQELRTYILSLLERGKPNKVILEYLKVDLGLDICERTLRNYFTRLNIKRYNAVDDNEILRAIEIERNGPRKYCGYRYLHYALRTKHKLFVARNRVANILKRAYPATGRNNRQKQAWQRRLFYCPVKGTNFKWSLDGYDKLQEFGIFIHGCVDQFSRYIVWLRAYTTNRKPEVVVRYYLEAIDRLKVAPEISTSDYGHEADLIAASQSYWFRNTIMGGQHCHHQWTYSIQNCTIESFWRLYRERSAQFWIEKLNHLKDTGYYTGDIVDRWCVWAIFLPLINEDIKSVVAYHNAHPIRKQRNRLRPSAPPEDIFRFPQNFGGTRRGIYINATDIRNVMRELNLQTYELDEIFPSAVKCVIERWFYQNNIVLSLEQSNFQYKQLRSYFLQNA